MAHVVLCRHPLMLGRHLQEKERNRQQCVVVNMGLSCGGCPTGNRAHNYDLRTALKCAKVLSFLCNEMRDVSCLYSSACWQG